MRRAARKDDNQNDIVSALTAMGCDVHDASAVGGGFPDLVVGIRGCNILVECKDGAKAPSQRRLTTEQQIFHTAWRGPVHVVETVDEAIALINRYRRSKN